MSMANTPEPPYTAVIFTSLRAAEHLVAQERGREVWYADYRVRVCTVTRDYGPGGADVHP